MKYLVALIKSQHLSKYFVFIEEKIFIKFNEFLDSMLLYTEKKNIVQINCINVQWMSDFNNTTKRSQIVSVLVILGSPLCFAIFTFK